MESMGHAFTILGRGKAGRALAEATGVRGVVIEGHEARPLGPVLLALPDRILEEYQAKFKGRCAHMSGSLHIDGVPSLHPLTSFDGTAKDWTGVPLAVTGEPPSAIMEAFVSLGFIPFNLPPELKPLYHACAVMVSGSAAALWLAADRLLSEAGVALPGKGLFGLAEASLRNVAEHGLEGLTGPFARDDEATIQRDRSALPRDFRELFMRLGELGRQNQ